MKPISAQTDVYCLIGHPVAHSLSPRMHNRAFAKTGIDAVYVAFDTADPEGAAEAVRTLGIRGASVTIPHKVAIMDCLDEIDEHARSIGAVNTIVNRGGRLLGTNTDGQGAVQAILEHTPLAGKNVVIIGAGGAARAVGKAIAQQGANLYIANRTKPRAKDLAAEMQAEYAVMDDLSTLSMDVLINTTPVGMHPNTEAMPVSKTVLRPGLFVMDIVYNPVCTCLLAAARSRGCHVIDGVGMFVYQGAHQFTLWTNREAPVTKMRQEVYDCLNNLDS